MKVPEKYSVVKRHPSENKTAKWIEIREKLRALPTGQAIRIPVPKGRSLRNYAQTVRMGITGEGKIEISVSEDRKKNVVEVWEKRQVREA